MHLGIKNKLYHPCCETASYIFFSKAPIKKNLSSFSKIVEQTSKHLSLLAPVIFDCLKKIKVCKINFNKNIKPPVYALLVLHKKRPSVAHGQQSWNAVFVFAIFKANYIIKRRIVLKDDWLNQKLYSKVKLKLRKLRKTSLG